MKDVFSKTIDELFEKKTDYKKTVIKNNPNQYNNLIDKVLGPNNVGFSVVLATIAVASVFTYSLKKASNYFYKQKE